MPVNKQVKSGLSKVRSASRTAAKAAGTRVGTLSDWRHESGKSGKASPGRRNAFRDGR